MFDDIEKASYNYNSRFRQPSNSPTNKSMFHHGNGVEINWMDQKNVGSTSRTRNEMGIQGRTRFSNLPYPHQSRYHPSYLNRVDRVHHNGKAEILKKIDELKDQIIRSSDLPESPRERFNNVIIDPNRYYKPNLSNNFHNRHVSDPYYNQTSKRPSDKNYHRSFDDLEVFTHEPDCSCFKCYDENIQVPGKVVYRPIAGGAPFMLCTSCFQLLIMPRKGVMNGRNEQQVLCGNCSAIFFIRVEKNRIVHIPKASQQVSNEVGNLQSYNHHRFGTKESCSIDFDNSSFDFQNREFGNQKKSTLEMETELNDKALVSGCTVSNPKEVASDKNEMDGSNFVGIITQERNQNETELGKEIPCVIVNGQPLADHIVQKAEKLAGPIQPGNYWYDFQAGFWGVIGHPCLGIVPPFIEEFRCCPMAEHCGGGNTEIYVNGRELHDSDLELLGNRGLPRTRNKSYVVLFSGRVFDKYTGHELKNIGKLAPTVQRQMCGFGMKVPRFLPN